MNGTKKLEVLKEKNANILTKTHPKSDAGNEWYATKTKPRKTRKIKNKTEVRHNQHDHQSYLVSELHFD